MTPRAVILLVSPSQRQSFELFHKIHRAYDALHRPIPAIGDARSQGRLELANGARVLALPGTEATIRGFSGVTLLLIDEAAKVSDELYSALRPMLAVSQGRLVCLSTPFGQRGFFWREWVSKGPWQRIGITYRDCPRISEEFVREEERALGQDWVDQEYRCLFTALHGLVYPEFASCLIDTWPQPQGQAVGGIDWGFHNPFAAVWGIRDADDVLWIGWERYARQTALHDHLASHRAEGVVPGRLSPTQPRPLVCRSLGAGGDPGVSGRRLEGAEGLQPSPLRHCCRDSSPEHGPVEGAPLRLPQPDRRKSALPLSDSPGNRPKRRESRGR